MLCVCVCVRATTKCVVIFIKFILFTFFIVYTNYSRHLLRLEVIAQLILSTEMSIIKQKHCTGKHKTSTER